jgi:hypothetical protein
MHSMFIFPLWMTVLLYRYDDQNNFVKFFFPRYWHTSHSSDTNHTDVHAMSDPDLPCALKSIIYDEKENEFLVLCLNHAS